MDDVEPTRGAGAGAGSARAGGAGEQNQDELVAVRARLTGWLQAHAPATAEAVLAPLGTDALALAQSATGGNWPPDVATFYRLCDGTERAHGAALFPGLRPYPLFDPEYGSAMVEQWRSWQEMIAQQARNEAATAVDPREANLRAMAGLDPTPPLLLDPARYEAQPAGTEVVMWLPSWLPIAEDQSGSTLVADRRGGAEYGCLLLVDKVDMDHQAERWPSLTALLGAVSDAVSTGEYIPGTRWRPEVVDGALSWERGPRHEDR